MARVSTSSSSAANGHIPTPANAEVTPTSNNPVSSVGGDYNEDDDDEPEFDFDDPRHAAASKTLPHDPTLLPNGSRSLSSIGLQSFALGFTLSASLLLTAWCVSESKPIWRLPAFFACLSLFHFLEYYTTARYNLPAARKSSFLLFNNGTAYNIAHGLATLEIAISNFVPSYRDAMVFPWSIALGLMLVVVGQTVRSVAMAQAGTNFNHTPAKTRRAGHELVSTGVYGYLRHPSYFGFFWWALGTQVLVGNKVCCAGYAIALWKFFSDRIIGKWRNGTKLHSFC